MSLSRVTAVALVATALGACSLLVDGEPVPLKCAQEGRLGPPACDSGFVCRRGVCVAGQPVSDAGAPHGASAGGDAGRQPGQDGDGGSWRPN